MAQQQRRSGGTPPAQQNRRPAAPAVTDEQRKHLLRDLMSGVESIRRSIEGVLPADVSFDRFRAILMTAIRVNPKILECTAASILNCCLKAAYDGVNLDGREAAMVPSNNKTGNGWRKEARYTIMVAGMRKQIIRGGLVRDVKTVIVYLGDKYKRVEGSAPQLIHEPCDDDAARGEPRAAYSMAWFKDSTQPTWEVMTKAEIEIVRDNSQSGDVWEGPHYLEMWRKTVLRRHRKSLPGCNDVIDMEAREMFPQFAGGDLGLLPDGRPNPLAPATPKRGDFQPQLADQQGSESGFQVDFGPSGEMTEEEVLREQEEQAQPTRDHIGATTTHPDDAGQNSDEADKASGQDPDKSSDKPAERNIGAVPEGHASWEAWADEVAASFKVAPNIPKLEERWKQHQEQIAQAPDEVHRHLTELHQLKLSDHREAMK